MDSTDFEVGVIGGGLAGIASAIQLARKGHSVILFEKYAYPKHKVCGEYLSMESWDFLCSLGLDLPALQLPRVQEVRLTTRYGGDVKSNLPLGGFGMSRYTLDHQLVEIARNEGVQVRENCEVRKVGGEKGVKWVKTRDGEAILCELLLGSFGRKDPFLNTEENERKKNYLGVKYHVKADLPDDRIELHVFPGGYCGISKVDDDRYCLCYLVNAAQMKKVKGGIPNLEKEILSKNPVLSQYLENFPRLYEKPEVVSHVVLERKPLITENFLTAGDAAGVIAPLCGNGMSMAFHASRILSPLISTYLKGGISREAMENRYEKAWNKEFRTRMKVGNSLQNLFFQERMIDLSLRGLRLSPPLFRKLIRMTHGKMIPGIED